MHPLLSGHGRNVSVFSIRKNFPLKQLVSGVFLFMDTMTSGTRHASLFILAARSSVSNMWPITNNCRRLQCHDSVQ